VALLSQLTWQDVDAGSLLLAVPLGSTEQHGPHLPLETDTVLACALAERLAAARRDVVVAPALPYGSSGEHSGFPGTISIGQAALELAVVELVRSADAFPGVVLVSAHGGNAEPLARAVTALQGEGRRVLAWAPRPPAVPNGERWDAHAGYAETSMLLALDPTRVRLDRAAAGATKPIERLLPALRSSGVAAVSPTGVLGDPRGASAEEGAALLNALAADLAGAVARWVKER
jgi:mycofactocin precursor peptide peptidase